MIFAALSSTAPSRPHSTGQSCKQTLRVAADVLDLFCNGGEFVAVSSTSFGTKVIVKFISVRRKGRDEGLSLRWRQSSKRAGHEIMKREVGALSAKSGLFQGGDTAFESSWHRLHLEQSERECTCNFLTDHAGDGRLTATSLAKHQGNKGGRHVTGSAPRAPQSYSEDGRRIAGTANGSPAAPLRRPDWETGVPHLQRPCSTPVVKDELVGCVLCCAFGSVTHRLSSVADVIGCSGDSVVLGHFAARAAAEEVNTCEHDNQQGDRCNDDAARATTAFNDSGIAFDDHSLNLLMVVSEIENATRRRWLRLQIGSEWRYPREPGTASASKMVS